MFSWHDEHFSVHWFGLAVLAHRMTRIYADREAFAPLRHGRLAKPRLIRAIREIRGQMERLRRSRLMSFVDLNSFLVRLGLGVFRS
jgi:hypothetical protein